MKKYYIAYGSNLNVQQMKVRCPGAVIVGQGELKDWRLLFRGSKTGAYLTIMPEKGMYVPVAIWSVTKQDELALDRYEGYPTFYYKKMLTLNTGVPAFAYIMHEDRPMGIPSVHYMDVCKAGYDAFEFDKKILDEAYNFSCGEVWKNENK